MKNTPSFLAVLGLVACSACSSSAPAPSSAGGSNESARPEDNATSDAQTGCQLTAHSELKNGAGEVLSRTVRVYDFDSARRLVRFSSQSFGGASAVGAEPTVITYEYADDGALSVQTVEAGVGRYADVYRRTYTYDEQEFVVLDQVDIGRDGEMDLTLRYTNTYDELDLRERVVDVDDRRPGMDTGFRERETWTPDETRTTWTHVNRHSNGRVRMTERYGIVGQRVAWREVDMGGNGTVDFREDYSEPATGDVRTEYDDFGRPIEEAHLPSGETNYTSYEDSCGGIAIPSAAADEKFRTPGLPKR
jgi:YD repeat-containing protein